MNAKGRPSSRLRRLIDRPIRQLRRAIGASRGAMAVARWRLATRDAPALPEWTGPATTRHPIFVGGTGRSGTTVTARILGAHPDYRVVPYEIHFISDAGGLCDAVEGHVSTAQFERRFIRRWWVRPNGHGVHLVAPRPLVVAALRELRRTFSENPAEAARRFSHRLLDPIAANAGAAGWIEQTPGNVLVAPTLLRIFPDAQLIHSVRDGRDVACSVARLPWGPSDPEAALRWWGERLEKSFRAGDGLPPERVLVVQQEALTTHARERELLRLLTWAGLDDQPAVRRFFDDNVDARRAHRKRWLQDVRPERRDAFVAAHAEIARKLAAHGWAYVPDDVKLDEAAADEAPPDVTTRAAVPAGVADPGVG